MRKILSVCFCLLLAACASQPQNQGLETTDNGDPIEGINRATFEFNYFLDGLLLNPVGALYRDLPPPAVRTAMDNVLKNLDEPMNFANTLLQGDVDQAGVTLMRFLINSTVGLLGMIDIAADWDLPYRDEDFGQTLAVWGMGDSGYVVLPVLGPSTSRDSIGRLVDFFADPFRYIAHHNDEESWIYGRSILNAASLKAKTIEPLKDIEQNSVDFYASVRSLYKQRRNFLIENKETLGKHQQDVEASLQPGSGSKLNLSLNESGSITSLAQ